jgi:hypothetical protein
MHLSQASAGGSDVERCLFVRLAVFADDFTLADAGARHMVLGPTIAGTV